MSLGLVVGNALLQLSDICESKGEGDNFNHNDGACNEVLLTIFALDRLPEDACHLTFTCF